MGTYLNPNQISARQLYEYCTSQDPEIQNRGYEILWRYLYTAALYLADFPDAEDLAQTALLKAFKKIRTAEEPDAFKGWARQILRNEYKNWLRKQKRNKEEEMPPDLPSGEAGPDRTSGKSIEYLFNCSQSRKARWAWIGRYYYDFQDRELGEIESLLCKRKKIISAGTYASDRAKTKKEWEERGLIDILIQARFHPIDPTSPDTELNTLLQQLLILGDWTPLYTAPLNEESRWAWIGRHIYKMSNEDLARVENLLCKTSVGAKIMIARRNRTQEVLKSYLLNLTKNRE